MIDFLMSCNLSAAHRIQWEWYPRLPADKAHGLQIGSGRAVCVAIFLYGHAIFILHVFRREHPYIFDPPNACCGYPCNYLTHLIRFCTMTNVMYETNACPDLIRIAPPPPPPPPLLPPPLPKSPHWGLNPGPSVYKTDALPLSYRGHATSMHASATRAWLILLLGLE